MPLLYEQVSRILARSLLADALKCISVLKLVFDRIDAPPELSKMNVDISRMLLIVARFISRSDVSRAGLRAKIKFCQLCDSLIAKRNFLTIRKESALRNELVDKLFQWTKETQPVRCFVHATAISD